VRLLIVRTSSLGDILLTLPALSDAARARPGLRVDWLVEERFSEIPTWHPAVQRTIPVALRRWRRQFAWRTVHEIRQSLRELRSTEYDLIVDAQGLMKSALMSRIMRGKRCGPDHASAREPAASLAYHQRVQLDRGDHAIDRTRRLFAACLGYRLPDSGPDYGIDPKRLPPRRAVSNPPYVAFVHGASWESKLWPEQYWQALARLVHAAGCEVVLPWGSQLERQRAERLGAGAPGARVLPPLNLGQAAAWLRDAAAVVAVDSGLGHLAVALGTPVVSLYGATDPGRTGTRGPQHHHLQANYPCSPCLARTCRVRDGGPVQPACFATVSAERVWSTLAPLLVQREADGA
jgi:heptosyltransferase-1